MGVMEIKVDVKKRTNGNIQIAAFRSRYSLGFSLQYATPPEARKVLVALGLPEKTIDHNLELLAHLGPREVLHFQAQEIGDDVLQTLGFQL